MSTRTLYDLAGADPDCRFSPFCWRIRMALAHKGLEVETLPWRFTEKDRIAFAGTDKVPVLVDGARTVTESWDIAGYLEEAYPHGPSLFGGEAGRGLARFVASWSDAVVHPAMARVVLLDIHDRLDAKDQAYFRQSREARFGMTLEQVVEDRPGRIAALRRDLHPMRMTLRAQPFLHGEEPGYGDYAVFGAFMWARAVSPAVLLEADDPVEAWRQRLLDLHGGLARRAKGHEV